MRTRILIAILAPVALGVVPTPARQAALLDNVDRLTLHDVTANRVTYGGRPAVRVAEPTVNAGGGMAIVPGLQFAKA